MKAKKERFQYHISETSYNKIAIKALDDGYRQAVAELLYLLATDPHDKWGKKRLSRLYERLDEMNHFPKIFGRSITGEDMIQYVQREYGISVDELELQIDIHAEE